MANTDINILIQDLPVSPSIPSTDDIIVLEDISEGTTKKIEFSVLQDAIFSTSEIESKIDIIISSINSSNTSINAGTFNGNTASYYLDYNNFFNIPTLPTLLSELSNDLLYVNYNQSEGVLQRPISVGSSVNVPITSDDLNEGSLNLFYTDERIEKYLVQNNYIPSGPIELPIQSQIGVNATIGAFNGSNRQQLLVDSEFRSKMNNFKEFQIIRVYGTDTEDVSIGAPPGTPTITLNGFVENTNTGHVTIKYKIARFNINNLKTTSASEEVSININDPLGLGNDPLTIFNVSNNIRLNFNVPNTNNDDGVLVYRDIGDGFKLIAVLGQKEVVLGRFIDYYDFDYVIWSKKNTDNSYDEKLLIHFPYTPPTEELYGYKDFIISSVDEDSRIIVVEVSNELKGNRVSISHNDTVAVQDFLINSSKNRGFKARRCEARDYVVSGFTLPNDFTLIGSELNTRFRKLPWSLDSSGTLNMVKAGTQSAPSKIGLIGIDFDGHLENQFLQDDSTTLEANYLINFNSTTSTEPQEITFSKVRVLRPVGGGVFVEKCNDLNISSCYFQNSGYTDRYDFSPLRAFGNKKSKINETTFSNFTQYVDSSFSDRTVITNNLVENCGSGLFVAGSTFLLSSPNILIGPSREFIPSPDILNSTFDLVNITLERGNEFLSDQYVYQENGINFNLAQSPKNSVLYDIYKLKKDSNTGLEILYEEITDVTLDDIVTNQDRTLGQFRYNISANNVTKLLDDYNTVVLSNTEPDHEGLVYRARLREHVEGGTIESASIGASFDGSNTIYDIEVRYNNTSLFANNQTVELIDHAFVTNGSVSSTATILSAVDTSIGGVNQVDLSLKYIGEITSVPNTASLGIINIINTFTLAHGRII